MYWLFRVKGWAPGDYARMSPGERDLVLALAPSCGPGHEKAAPERGGKIIRIAKTDHI